MNVGMSAIGTKRTSLFAAQMSAFDPKRTSLLQYPEEGTFCLGQKSAGANCLWRRQAFSRRLAAAPTGQRCRKSHRVVNIRLQTTSFYGISHIVEYKDREGRHALPLFGTKSFV